MQYFEKLNVNYNFKSFWKKCKRYFSNKIVIYKKILCCMKKINCYQNRKMSDSRKCANVRPICKKWTLLIKRIIDQWVYYHFIKSLWKRYIRASVKFFWTLIQWNLRGFRKALSPKHTLFKLLTSWKILLNIGGFVGSIIMDLSKAYDCLKDDLLLPKLQCRKYKIVCQVI